MELGNMAFGISRGEVPVFRDAGYEELLDKLFDFIVKYLNKGKDYSKEAIAFNSGYGIDFENDTFEIHPYYWGDCTCGYEKLEYQWSEDNEHIDECYRVEYHNLSEEYGGILKIPKKKVKELCTDYGIYYNRGIGCAIHCTCSYKKRWNKFLESNNHKKDCPIVRPNFLYKPNGYELKWYKYPLRDSYASEELSLIEFTKMIEDCINSIERSQV
jgi:hypothetical protein